MSSTTTKNLAELWITSETLTPQEIAAYVGLDPGKVWERGKLPRPDGPYAWKTVSPLGRSESMEARVEQLLVRLGAFSGRIRALSENNDVT